MLIPRGGSPGALRIIQFRKYLICSAGARGVADARHSPERAARLLLEYFGRDYWCDPDCVEEDDEGNETFDGMTKDEYLDSLIVSVEAGARVP
jgi:hypothetical protein